MEECGDEQPLECCFCKIWSLLGHVVRVFRRAVISCWALRPVHALPSHILIWTLPER